MRWIVRIGVAVGLVLVVAVGMVFMLPSEKIGQIASDQLERATGRKLSLSGKFTPTFYPVLGVKTGPISISNADWAENPVMLSAEGISVGVGLAALVGGNLEVTKLRIEAPEINLEKARDGRVSWDFGGKEAAPDSGESSGVPKTFSLELAEITDGRVSYTDWKTNDTTTVSAINMRVSLPKESAEFTASGDAVWQGKKLAVDGTVADLKALLSGNQSRIDVGGDLAGIGFDLAGRLGMGSGQLPNITAKVGLSLADMSPVMALVGPVPQVLQTAKDVSVRGDVQLSDAGVSFDGQGGITLNGTPILATVELTGQDNWADTLLFDLVTRVTAENTLELGFDGQVNGSESGISGALDLASVDFHKLMGIVGVPLDSPAGTLQKIGLKGQFAANAAGEITLNKARIQVDNNVVSGMLRLSTAGRPFIAATLNAKALDLSRFTSDQGGGDTAPDGAPGWSKEPIELAGLDLVDADITLEAQSVNLGVSQLGVVNIRALLSKGLLTLRLNEVRAFQGVMTGALYLRGGNTLAFDSDVVARDMQLEPLLGELLDMDRLSGSGTTRMKLSGRGRSLHDIMNSLSGKGNIKFANGAIRGIDLAAMMRNLKSAFGGFEGATEFTSMTGSFTLVNGVLENVDLSLVSPLFKATGKGKVGIGGRFMDYVVTPGTLNGDAKVSVPVIITGPWDNLKFRPDLENLIDLVLQGKLRNNAEVQKAKDKLDKARAKLRNPKQTAQDELRNKAAQKLNTRDTSEKALKQKAEDKIKEELGNSLLRLLSK